MNRMERGWTRVLPWMTLYAVAMALLESAVVVDLRALYYPTGFRFPIVPIGRTIAITELFRELATMVMLLAPGAMVTRRGLERFAWFIYCFGVWDLFYYVFLKLVLDWPVSWLEWDILFLIPMPWVGPVLAPCIVAVGMVVFGVSILEGRRRNAKDTVMRTEWVLLLVSAAVMLYTFMEEPLVHAQRAQVTALSVAAGGDALAQWRDYVPARFNWPVFLLGAALGGGVLVRFGRRVLGGRVASDPRRWSLKK
ncbi:MAG: hypothetical protein JNL05_15255 [Flavobacteriales bacterium]|nr:hypothetical protein [Flavobacteriales bacterium]